MDAEKLNDLLRKQITLKPLENLKVELSAKDYREISLYREQYRRLYTVRKIEDYFVTNWKVRSTDGYCHRIKRLLLYHQ